MPFIEFWQTHIKVQNMTTSLLALPSRGNHCSDFFQHGFTMLSCRWTHTVVTLSCKASFIQHHVFDTHPCCSLYPSHYMNAQPLIHFSTDRHMGTVSSFQLLWRKLLHTFLHTSFGRHSSHFSWTDRWEWTCKVGVLSFYEDLQIFCQNSPPVLEFHQQSMRVPVAPQPLPTFVVRLPNFSHIVHFILILVFSS